MIMLNGTKSVTVRTQFEALHCWADAPDVVLFLRNPHRHVFWVLATLAVDHGDRAVEFFCVKAKLDQLIKELFLSPSLVLGVTPNKTTDNLGMPTISASCEDMAECLANALSAEGYSVRQVIVSEDNENAGTFTVIG